jgi:hypothetical protein
MKRVSSPGTKFLTVTPGISIAAFSEAIVSLAHAITVFTSEHSRNLPRSEASSFIREETGLEILEKGVMRTARMPLF